MKKGKKNWKRVVGAGLSLSLLFLVGCAGAGGAERNKETSREEQWEEAETTPLGRYPELVTYTLAKVTIGDHTSGAEDTTYENNAYTRYLRRILNVQNENVIETSSMEDYKKWLEMLIGSGEELPDVMYITDQDLLDKLEEKDLLEDLSKVYEECTSDRIKDMYASYGDDFLQEYIYDGKLIGFPSAEVDQGSSMLWLREDWMEELGFDDPDTPEEAYEIIQAFAEENPGGSPEGNIGLGFSLLEEDSQIPSFSIQPIYGLSYAYPETWIPDENGKMIYGSVESHTKDALAVIKKLYESGVLDKNFMLRTPENILKLVDSGACGAVFGLWSLPYGYLQTSRENQGAEWEPYLLCNEDGYVTAPYTYNKISCVVVRKGYEHPEIVPKILTAVYDYSRYEGGDDAGEIHEFHRTSGRWEVMPLAIDVNYKDSLKMKTMEMESLLSGEITYEEASADARGMVDRCKDYLDNKDTDVYGWVTCTARIRAVDELLRTEVRYVNEDCSKLRNIQIPEHLKKLEKETFIKIITGEKELDSFDDFVEEWYQSGGEELTRQVNHIVDQSAGGKEPE